jgi:hypothetical protein
VFFPSTQQLTNSASEDTNTSDSAKSSGCAVTTGPNGCNLYEYDFGAATGHNLIDVSAADQSGDGPRMQGALAISSDGSHVYFVAKGTLTVTPNAFGQKARDGSANLYLYERDATYPQGRTVFIATLPEADREEWNSGVGRANVVPNGRFLVFASHGTLTPDDLREDDAPQVFRYDAETGELIRITIGEHGYNDNGNSGTGEATIVEAEKDFDRTPARADPTMSDDGSHVFFTSPIALAPGALNDVSIGTSLGGQPSYARNVYEYHDGQVSLISDGKDTSEVDGVSSVHLIGSDTSGSNVFFTTADSLVPQDTDTQLDYYDARICTSSNPCIPPATPEPTGCQGEACHGQPSTPPQFGASASATLSGAGNLAATAPPAVKPKSLTRAQKLAKALKLCKKDRSRSKRAKCEKTAHSKFGPSRRSAKKGKK